VGTISMQFPTRLHVTPDILTFDLANASVLFTLFVICALSFLLLDGGGDTNMNVSWLSWCHVVGFDCWIDIFCWLGSEIVGVLGLWVVCSVG
jgi:hypothetical protein